MSEFSKFWMGPALAAALAFGSTCALAEDAATPAAEPTAEPAAPEDAPVSADTVVATVNGTAITLGNMIVLREKLPAEYQKLPDDVLFKGILDQMIQQTALQQSIEDDVSRRDLLALENDRRSYLASVAIDRAMGVTITDEALQALYDEKFASAAPTKEFHAAHILVPTEEEATKLKADIDAGTDFGEVAMAHSTDGAAAGGGDLGWFGLGQMVKEFEDAVVAMEAGQVSEPVQTQFGWHLIKLIETRSAAAPILESVRGDLVAELQQKAVEARILQLTSTASISRSADGIDPAVLRDATLLAN